MASDSSPQCPSGHIEPALCVIPAHDYRRTRWRNGLGWTREILRRPDADGWNWRLSIAEIQGDMAFSEFPGVERMLVLLHGEGLQLQVDAATDAASNEAAAKVDTVEIASPHGRFRFAGERSVRALPSATPVHVFNLMWRREGVAADLWHRPLVGSMVLFLEPGEQWVVFLIGGRATLSDGAGHRVALAAQDTAVVAAQAQARQRYLLDGGGEALLIRIRPAGG